MASPPSGQASELFTPPNIPLNHFSCTAGQALDGWGGGRRRRRARRPAPGSRGVASGLRVHQPARHRGQGGYIGHCLGSAKAMHPPEASTGGWRRWAPVAPQAMAPNPIS
eukprot:1759799-Pleurochrysis_carterae.AAC.2